MRLKLLERPASHLGIDLGSSGLRVVELRRGSSGLELRHCAVEELPAGSGEVDLVASGLRRLLDDQQITSRRAVVSIGGQDIAMRRVLIPAVPEDEILGALRWQVRDQFPFPLDDAMLAYHHLGRYLAEDREMLDLLVTAATRESVERRVEILRRAGLQCRGVVAEAHALAQLWRQARMAADDQAQAVVDLGATKTSVHIFEGEDLKFSRDLPTAGEDFTAALTGRMRAAAAPVEVSAERAKFLKHRYGIPAPGQEGETEEGISLTQLLVRLRPVLEKLETDITRSLEYYGYHYRGRPISTLLLAGGGSRMQGIERFFSEWFEGEVEIFDPATAIGLAAKADALVSGDKALLGIALGLGLPLQPEYNLLPAEYLQRRAWKLPSQVGYGLAAALFVLPLFQYHRQSNQQVEAIRQEIAAKQVQVEAFQPLLAQLQRLQQENSDLDRRLAAYPKYGLKRVDLAAALAAVSRTMPPPLTLTAINFVQSQEEADVRLHLEGLVFAERKTAYQLVTHFMEELENSGVFALVEAGAIEASEEVKAASLAFEIVCRFE